MANEGKFSERGFYGRPLIWPAVLRRLAMGLIVLGAGTIPMGIWADNVFVTNVGIIGVIAGGAWWLYFTLPDP